MRDGHKQIDLKDVGVPEEEANARACGFFK